MSVIQALGPAFAMAFAVQQDPEILDPAIEGGDPEEPEPRGMHDVAVRRLGSRIVGPDKRSAVD
jgi:hypothetical protein